MAQAPHGPRSVAEAAERFLSSRHPGSLISTAAGIRAIREFVPVCEHTDDELAQIVAALAVHQRRNVSFDAKLT